MDRTFIRSKRTGIIATFVPTVGILIGIAFLNIRYPKYLTDVLSHPTERLLFLSILVLSLLHLALGLLLLIMGAKR